MKLKEFLARLTYVFAALVLFAVLSLRLGDAHVVHAATFYIVDGDVNALIDAINTANGNGQADTINLAGNGNYTLTLGSLPIISSEIIINGNSATIERSNAPGTPAFRIFDVVNGDITLNDLTISHGDAHAGGGILNDGGTVTLNNSTVSNNIADFGGGIENAGDLFINGSTVTNNEALADGGGIDNDSGTVTIDNSFITDNRAEFGGGIENLHGNLVTITNSTVSGNTADFGGGIENLGTLDIRNSTISNNDAFLDGGGVESFGNANVVITDSTISGNTSGGIGGGLDNFFGSLSIFNSDVEDNKAAFGGGGIFNLDGSLTVSESTISGNKSEFGAGIENGFGVATIDSSTIVGNEAKISGGGIDSEGPNLTIKNSTITGNSSLDIGGGISHVNGLLKIKNTTVASNSAPIGAGLFNDLGADVDVSNTIIAQNRRGDDCDGDVSGINSQGNNLDSDGTCNLTNPNDLPNTNPKLGPLQNNGGPTDTRELLLGSPAIDAGNAKHCLPVDQRGVTRAQGSECDIGAFEQEITAGADIAVTMSDSPDPVSVGQMVIYSVEITNNGPRSARVMLNNKVPDGKALPIQVITSQGGCIIHGTQRIQCGLGKMLPGDVATVEIHLQVTASGSITNQVKVEGNKTDPDLSNNVAREVTTGTP